MIALAQGTSGSAATGEADEWAKSSASKCDRAQKKDRLSSSRRKAGFSELNCQPW